jgi:3-deoxy-D-manno-octulosonic-acid transferase
MLAIGLYNIGITILLAAMRIAALFNPKARRWVNGRKNLFSKLKVDWAAVKADSEIPTIWMHASSLGEFEQGKPIIERLRKDKKPLKIIVSFFSPSGYEVAKNYALADYVCYLPVDNAANAKQFLDIIQPDLVIWIKYEYWFHMLRSIQQRKIPLLLVSAIFMERQPFFKWYGKLHREMLHFFTHLFVQTSGSAELLVPLLPPEKFTISGDTRFDRVLALAAGWQPIPVIEKLLPHFEKVVVAGSTWPDDEKELSHLVKLHKEILWIIVPHHVDKVSVSKTLERFPNSMLFSDLYGNTKSYASYANVLVIDTMGLLSRAYNYATICYLGGGFTATGIHNILEPAVYGKPVVMGPEYFDYAEAIELVKVQGAFPFETTLALEQLFDKLLKDKEAYDKASAAAANFTQSMKGATNKIMDYIYINRLITN